MSDLFIDLAKPFAAAAIAVSCALMAGVDK